MITSQQVLEKIAEALEIDIKNLNIESSSENIEKWDSLGQLAILSALDELFSGAISDIPDIESSRI